MKNYIDSQEHWEDSINADYDDRQQHDDRQQCYKTGKECKYKCSGLCKESC